MCFNRRITPDLQCFVTKKAREITPMQNKEQTDTFRYWRATDEMRQDTVYSFYLYLGISSKMTYIQPSGKHLSSKSSRSLNGDNPISAQWYFCSAIVRALKASQAMGTVRAYAGEVEFLWSGLASCHSLLLRILISDINRFILNLIICGIKHRQNSGGLEWTENWQKYWQCWWIVIYYKRSCSIVKGKPKLCIFSY